MTSAYHASPAPKQWRLGTRLKLLLSCLPVVVTWGGWKAAFAINEALGCDSIFKGYQSCIWLGWDLQPLLGFAWAWGGLLWMPCFLISGLLWAEVLAGVLPKPWGKLPRR